MTETEPSARPLLWLVDDDQALAAMLREYLELQRFEVELHDCGESALAGLQTGRPPQLIILDVTLPGISGFETLSTLRRMHHTPVIMLTARGEETDRIAGLLGGADDYLSKPFNPLELAARIRAVLKRSTPIETTSSRDPTSIPIKVLRCGNLTLDLRRREALVNGSTLPLTAGEMRVLEHLLRRRGEVLSRAELTELALGRSLEVYDRSIDTLVSKLRRKLADAGAKGGEIRGLRGHGYVFDGGSEE